MILSWWFCCPLLARTFAPSVNPIVIQRTTGAYHGWMAVILFTGYLLLVVYNLWQRDPKKRVNIPWLLITGVLVQFGWECGLLVGGIRSAGFQTAAEKLAPLIINSLLETNLGMPYIFAIFIAYSKKYTEQLSRREKPLSFAARLEEWNRQKVRAALENVR